ncbi:MAG TPA: hypothetical protein VD931_09905 [Baekduia sp.]|nr:hypothetical protein [Baekduia sp.]
MALLPRSLTTGACAALAVLAASGASPGPAAAAARDCSGVPATTLRAEGRQLMGAMLGSRGARAGMDRMMRSVMGERASRQAYEAMGAAARGCPAEMPGAMGQMVGAIGPMMGAGAMRDDTGAGNPMRGDRDGMMDGREARWGMHDGWGAFETVMVVLLALLLVAITAAAVAVGRRGRPVAH